MLFNPVLHNQLFANQPGKREKLACFRAKLASCPIASSPSNRHSCFCVGAKQPVIIAISQASPAASIPNLSSFRAYYELIMSLLRAHSLDRQAPLRTPTKARQLDQSQAPQLFKIAPQGRIRNLLSPQSFSLASLPFKQEIARYG